MPSRKIRLRPVERLSRSIEKLINGSWQGKLESAALAHRLPDARMRQTVIGGHTHIDENNNLYVSGIGERDTPSIAVDTARNVAIGDGSVIGSGTFDSVIIGSFGGIADDSGGGNVLIGPSNYMGAPGNDVTLIGEDNFDYGGSSQVGIGYATQLAGNSLVAIGENANAGDIAGFDDYPTFICHTYGHAAVNTGSESILIGHYQGQSRQNLTTVMGSSLLLQEVLELFDGRGPISVSGGEGFISGTLNWVDASDGNVDVNLLAIEVDDGTRDLDIAGRAAGTWYIFKKVDSTANTVTINADAADSIEGAASIVLTDEWDYVSIFAIALGFPTPTTTAWVIAGGRVGGVPI